MRRCVGTVGTHHGDVGIDFLVVTLSCASVHIRGIVGRLAARDRPYAYSYARLVPHLTHGLHRVCGSAGVSSSSLVDMAFATEGPTQGIKSNN